MSLKLKDKCVIAVTAVAKTAGSFSFSSESQKTTQDIHKFIIEMNRQSTFLRFVKAENLSIASLRELLVLVFGVWFSVKFQICPFHRTSLSDLCFTWRVWMKDDLLNQRVWSSADLRAFVFSQISLTSSGPWTGSWWSIPPRRAASDTSPLGYTR